MLIFFEYAFIDLLNSFVFIGCELGLKRPFEFISSHQGHLKWIHNIKFIWFQRTKIRQEPQEAPMVRGRGAVLSLWA